MDGEHRRHLRVPAYAKAILADQGLPGYVRDLSTDGCLVSFLQPPRAAVGDLVTVTVVAAHDTSIPPFRVRLRVRRLVDDPPWHSLGTQVEGWFEDDPAGAFEKMVSYYAGAGP